MYLPKTEMKSFLAELFGALYIDILLEQWYLRPPVRSWHLPIPCLFYSSSPICQLTGFLAIEACLLPSENWISPIIPPVRKNYSPGEKFSSSSIEQQRKLLLVSKIVKTCNVAPHISVWVSCGQVSQCECVWVSGVRPAFKRLKQPATYRISPLCSFIFEWKAIGCMPLWQHTTSFAKVVVFGN